MQRLSPTMLYLGEVAPLAAIRDTVPEVMEESARGVLATSELGSVMMEDRGML